MTLSKAITLLIAALLPSLAIGGHHEKAEAVSLAAQPGQMMIVYHWPCANAERGLSLLKEMIAYERTASPFPYSAAPAIHADGAVVSVDVHPSAESMEQAGAWQESDEEWQRYLNTMADACGSLEDLTASVLTMQ